MAAVTLGHILKLKREKKDDDYVWGVVIVVGLSSFSFKKWPLGRQCASELAGVVAGNKLFLSASVLWTQSQSDCLVASIRCQKKEKKRLASVRCPDFEQLLEFLCAFLSPFLVGSLLNSPLSPTIVSSSYSSSHQQNSSENPLDGFTGLPTLPLTLWRLMADVVQAGDHRCLSRREICVWSS